MGRWDVNTIDGLYDAFHNAQPGDAIVVEPGEYVLDGRGPLEIRVSDLTINMAGSTLLGPFTGRKGTLTKSKFTEGTITPMS